MRVPEAVYASFKNWEPVPGSQPCACFSKGWENKRSEQRGGSWWEQWGRAPWTAQHPELNHWVWPERRYWAGEGKNSSQNNSVASLDKNTTVIPQELVIVAANIQTVGVLFDPFQENVVYFTAQFLFVSGGNSLSEHQWVQDWFLGKGWCQDASRWLP